MSLGAAGVLAACGGGGGGGAPTTAPTWGLSQVIATGGITFLTSTDVAINLSGEGQAAWLVDTTLGVRVAGRRYANGVWQDGFSVISTTNTPDFPAAQPQVAVLSNGEAIAVWVETGGGLGTSVARVKASRTVDRVWETPVLIEEQPQGALVRSLDVVADDRGGALVVWAREPETDLNAITREVRASAFRDNIFQLVNRVNLVTTDADTPSVGVDAEGRALVVWRQPTQGVDRIFVRAYKDDVWQTTATEINPGANLAGSLPKISIGANGKAAVAWRGTVNATTHVPELSTTDNFLLGEWSPPQVLAQTVGSSILDLDVTQDPRGTTTVAWVQRDGAPADTDLWAIRVGASASIAQKIDAVNADSALNLSVASDAAGGAVAVWEQDMNPAAASNVRPLANRFDPASGQWVTAELIDTGNTAGVASKPALAMNANGQALATWAQTSAQGIISVVANVFK